MLFFFSGSLLFFLFSLNVVILYTSGCTVLVFCFVLFLAVSCTYVTAGLRDRAIIIMIVYS